MTYLNAAAMAVVEGDQERAADGLGRAESTVEGAGIVP